MRRVLAEPGELSLVCIGPLTNVARALADPVVAAAVREVVAMGGVYLEQTNVAAMPGEYNFWCDPEAAQVVLESGVPLRLVGLDVTRRVRLTRADAGPWPRAVTSAASPPFTPRDGSTTRSGSSPARSWSRAAVPCTTRSPSPW